MNKKIEKAIISVYYKDGLDEILNLLYSQNVEIYSTGGTYNYITSLGIPCVKVEDITKYPEILGGRVKTLHPSIFGGLLARTDNNSDLREMKEHALPFFDLMICNLYPFDEYISKGAENNELIEKIDIGGVSLIRAAAKNFNDVCCIADPSDYPKIKNILETKGGYTSIDDRKRFAANAFRVISAYDQSISNWFLGIQTMPLRYGENPHQAGNFEGNFEEIFDKLHGKEISYNNMLDIDACAKLIADFSNEPTFAIIKHNNSCGLASASTIFEAYQKALACDPTSAFGGVLISNGTIDKQTSELIHNLFFEILIAPNFDEEALTVLKQKKNRILLKQKKQILQNKKIKTALNGILVQDGDNSMETRATWKVATNRTPSESEQDDLEFGIKAVKHLKSNGIAIIKNKQLVGMGCGQTSRVDALQHAIKKSKEFQLDLNGAIMASDAFFPFSDCVEIAHACGIKAVAQPGGSIKDQDSIDFCNSNQITMVMTGVRHFNH